MKILIHRACKTLRSQKGETLVESVVSMIMLSIFLVAITAIIHAGARMTSASTQNARRIQEEVINPVLAAEYNESSDEVKDANITFSFNVNGTPMTATHGVLFYEGNGLKSFTPDLSE